MRDRVFNVLFLCTGNSARSIMGEVILNREGVGKFKGYSAGSTPKGFIHPYTLDLIKNRDQQNAARAIMIGDSETDIATAKAARIPVVAVAFGYSVEPVSAFAPDVIISHFDELDAAARRIAAKGVEVLRLST